MGTNGTFVTSTSEYLTKEAVEKFKIKVIPVGSVVLSFKLTVGRVSISALEMCTNEAIAHFYNINTELSSSHFIYLFLKQFDFQSLGSTSSIAEAVNSKTVKAIKVIVPPIERLKKFESVITPIFDKIMMNTRSINTLTQTRDTLLPKLMSGEVRVKLD
jgi:type I restriction enzyme S subunit